MAGWACELGPKLTSEMNHSTNSVYTLSIMLAPLDGINDEFVGNVLQRSGAEDDDEYDSWGSLQKSL